MTIPITPMPLFLSLERLVAIDKHDLRDKASRLGAQNMTEAKAYEHFDSEEIHLIKTFVMLETMVERRQTRRSGNVWVPPMILRGDYDEAFNVYSPKLVEFVEFLDILPIPADQGGHSAITSGPTPAS